MLIKHYIRYKLAARNEHAIHSPFVFDLYCRALKPQQGKYFQLIRVAAPDLNAPTRIEDNPAEVANIVIALKQLPLLLKQPNHISRHQPIKTIKLLARLLKYLKPSKIVDIGGSLGSSALLCAKAYPQAEIYLFEASKEKATLLEKALASVPNITLEVGERKTLFAQVLEKQIVPNIVYAVHYTYEELSAYLHAWQMQTNAPLLTFILEKPYSNAENLLAWQQIQQHPCVSISLDLYEIGLFFVGKNQAKQHFVLRF